MSPESYGSTHGLVNEGIMRSNDKNIFLGQGQGVPDADRDALLLGVVFVSVNSIQIYSRHQIKSINSIQFNSIQFNSIQFNSIQFNSIQLVSTLTAPGWNHMKSGDIIWFPLVFSGY
eukprot:SAG22_NODE_227_length_14641_cov_11.007908_3_plen_117_part_00